MEPPDDYDNSALAHEDIGYHKGLKPRQLQMIAMGGAIGTGLFMGTGARLHTAGPGLFVVYAFCGLFVFFILRALGELVLHRPSSGSFVSYAREFLGEKAAFVAGWMYFWNWAAAAIVDVTAIALYLRYWNTFRIFPQWSIALAALVVVLTMNMISVKLFGEMEFWAALIKVVALIVFLVAGTVFLAGGMHIDGQPTGPSLIASHGGLFPTGLLQVLIVTSGVVFAFAAVELVGTAAGETENPHQVMPRAINSVVLRIAVFYVGSVILLGLLLPYSAYAKNTSPFVSFFSHIGFPAAGHVMNFVVLTAALSSLNAGLYSTGRMLRSMAMNGSAPKFTARMSATGVPFAGILLTGCITLTGIGLNLVVPADAFNIALEVAALGIIASWGTIVICQLKLYRLSQRGVLARPSFRLPGTPYTSYATLLFLAVVVVLMCYENRWNLVALLAAVPMLIVGWFAVRNRVFRVASERSGFTGAFPVIAETPLMGGIARRDSRALPGG
ncbi:amino acid permease [Mycobacterium sp. SP-6446]|uniref:amino acid permease n=1 Tax=Mycobacterium sp. SP-6446 TaxID=1834162 RepID=UPI00096D4839|nr:amino acid permease [Mycobacterium sp. SP-6446]OMC13526.1 L-asparagine permease [Mycobacterium sp. SP-6446]